MENIILRKLEKDDTALVKMWLLKPHVKKWYKDTEEWIYEIEHRYDEYNWVHHYIVELNGKDIGFCQYYDYSIGGETWHNYIDIKNTYSIDYMIGEDDYIGKHLAVEMIKTLEKEIIKNTNAIKIIVQPETENKASRRALLSAGYTYNCENDLFEKKLL